MAWKRLNPLNEFAHEERHLWLCGVGSGSDFFVRYFDDFAEAAEVGDDADAEDAHSLMDGDDDFGHGAHANGIGSEQMEHAVLGRSFESGALGGNVDAVTEGDAMGGCDVVDGADEFLIVGFVHAGKARTGGDVLATQGIFGHHVDVVGDDHEVADGEGGVHASCCVGDEEIADAEFVHDADGEGDFLHVVAFVIMEASLHRHDVFAAEFSEYQFAGVAFNGRERKVGDVGIGDFLLYVDFFGKASESAAEDDGGVRLCVDFFLEKACCFLNSCVHILI